MYFTDRGIEELADRRGEDQVTLGWLAERLREFVDLHPGPSRRSTGWPAGWHGWTTRTRAPVEAAAVSVLSRYILTFAGHDISYDGDRWAAKLLRAGRSDAR